MEIFDNKVYDFIIGRHDKTLICHDMPDFSTLFFDEISLINRSFDEDKKIKEIIFNGLGEAMTESNLDLKGNDSEFNILYLIRGSRNY